MARPSVRTQTRQLHGHRWPSFSEQLRRSALGLVSVYNLLPQEVVGTQSVVHFSEFSAEHVEGICVAQRPRMAGFVLTTSASVFAFVAVVLVFHAHYRAVVHVSGVFCSECGHGTCLFRRLFSCVCAVIVVTKKEPNIDACRVRFGKRKSTNTSWRLRMWGQCGRMPSFVCHPVGSRAEWLRPCCKVSTSRF